MKNGTDFNGTSFLDAGHLKYLYMSPQGRINRQRIWIGGLLLGLAMIPILIVSGILIGIGVFLLASFWNSANARQPISQPRTNTNQVANSWPHSGQVVGFFSSSRPCSDSSDGVNAGVISASTEKSSHAMSGISKMCFSKTS